MFYCHGVSRFFFFKQKTAYDMLRSLVGSEMCIRDRIGFDRVMIYKFLQDGSGSVVAESRSCLLYTSDAADDLTRVDPGGRRILQTDAGARRYSANDWCGSGPCTWRSCRRSTMTSSAAKTCLSEHMEPASTSWTSCAPRSRRTARSARVARAG